jgi:hypothetical protein
MDQLISAHGARSAVFITAYNPLSRVRPPGANQRMQARLRQALRRRPVLSARGSWRGWTESHLLVVDDVRPMVRLARRFRQCAVVVIRPRQAAQLVFTS